MTQINRYGASIVSLTYKNHRRQLSVKNKSRLAVRRQPVVPQVKHDVTKSETSCSETILAGVKGFCESDIAKQAVFAASLFALHTFLPKETSKQTFKYDRNGKLNKLGEWYFNLPRKKKKASKAMVIKRAERIIAMDALTKRDDAGLLVAASMLQSSIMKRLKERPKIHNNDFTNSQHQSAN
jgi:hypothetical protein